MSCKSGAGLALSQRAKSVCAVHILIKLHCEIVVVVLVGEMFDGHGDVLRNEAGDALASAALVD